MRVMREAKAFTTEDTTEHRVKMRMCDQLFRSLLDNVEVRPLSDFFAPGLEILLHQGHELIGDGTVD
jgi:hypothetical protein